MRYRIPLTCLGVTPGMWISNAKSDESIGITGLVVPRHSLENDLVVSLNLQKEDNFNTLKHVESQLTWEEINKRNSMTLRWKVIDLDPMKTLKDVMTI